MKKITASIVLAFLFAAGTDAQTVTSLPKPDMNLGVTLTEALQNRHSARDYSSDKAISDQQLSLLLWAATGVNRTEKDLLTVPSAVNAQDILVYVCRADGVSLYDPRKNTLTQVSGEDVRGLLAGRQEWARTAPLFLLLVSDQTRFRGNAEHWGGVDAGYVSQDIYLMCAALGLKTVARGTMDKEGVAKVLGLDETKILELNHPVGY